MKIILRFTYITYMIGFCVLIFTVLFPNSIKEIHESYNVLSIAVTLFGVLASIAIWFLWGYALYDCAKRESLGKYRPLWFIFILITVIFGVAFYYPRVYKLFK